MGLRYAVITSVTRDDLPDGGAEHFASTVKRIREVSPDTKIELLVPDFQGMTEQAKKPFVQDRMFFLIMLKLSRHFTQEQEKEPIIDVRLVFYMKLPGAALLRNQPDAGSWRIRGRDHLGHEGPEGKWR